MDKYNNCTYFLYMTFFSPLRQKVYTRIIETKIYFAPIIEKVLKSVGRYIISVVIGNAKIIDRTPNSAEERIGVRAELGLEQI